MIDGPLTLGTAGHIDHGKSALIRALTGSDPDRLPEEQQRGISIELGYARLGLPSGQQLSVVDVPGHERYVRTMVAGATGIDMYLMAIAADDGVMPQTREHAAILAALGVRRGVVAVTKSDVAAPRAALTQARELFPEAEAVPVSATLGTGLDALRAALDRVAIEVPRRGDVPGAARLHIDRVFTIRGAGTVVTGTLWSGVIARGDRLELRPGRRRARAREIQVHDQSRSQARAGQRVAVNLGGPARDEVARGDVLVSDGSSVDETYLIDAELEFAPGVAEPESGTRVHIHHGTRETPARMAWLGGRFWQLRLEHPLLPAAGDRLVVRQVAPPDTMGGGRVLDPHPRKHGPGRELLAHLTRLSRGETEPSAEPGTATETEAEPLAEPRTATDRELPPPTDLAPLSTTALALEDRLRTAGFEPPPDSELDADALAELGAAGRAVRVTRTLHYHPETVTRGQEIVLELAAQHGGAVTLAQIRDRLRTSRKFAQALLEHLDSERVTIRRGDVHVVRRRARDV